MIGINFPIFLRIAEECEIIIVNDGSKDDTLKIADSLSSFDKRIKIINHEVNKGYGEALKSGFYSAKYPLIATTDADGQFDFSEITKLLEKIDKVDVVIGYRMDRKDQVGVHRFERRKGHQTGADMNVIIKSFSDLFSLWLQLR